MSTEAWLGDACLLPESSGPKVRARLRVHRTRDVPSLRRRPESKVGLTPAVTWTGLMSGRAGMLPFLVLTTFRACGTRQRGSPRPTVVRRCFKSSPEAIVVPTSLFAPDDHAQRSTFRPQA
ncbi:hypothetical protein [Streptomyces atratus]|uniref:hypothetical protein n=1 Tax=Streptomyces atratus TaxID=1893 RepID=UPI00379445A1